MFYYLILMYNEQNEQWFEWDSSDCLLSAKGEFQLLTGLGFTVKVLHCRDLNSGKDWID